MKNISWKLIPLFLILFFIFAYLIFEWLDLIHYDQLRNILVTRNILTACVIFTLLILDVIIPVPSTILLTFSGNIYGFTVGFLLNYASLLSASIIGFILGRYFQEYVKSNLLGKKEHLKMEIWFKKYGFLVVIFSKFVPIISETISIMAGLTGLKLKKFIFFSTLGILPISLYFSYLGSSTDSLSEWFLPLALTFFIPLFLWYFIRFN